MKTSIKWVLILFVFAFVLSIPIKGKADNTGSVQITDITCENDVITVTVHTTYPGTGYLIKASIVGVHDQFPEYNGVENNSGLISDTESKTLELKFDKKSLLDGLKIPKSGDYDIECTMHSCFTRPDSGYIYGHWSIADSGIVTKYLTISDSGISISDSGYKYPDTNKFEVTEIRAKGRSIYIKSSLTYKMLHNESYGLSFGIYKPGAAYPEKSYIIKGSDLRTTGTYTAKLEGLGKLKSGYYYIKSGLIIARPKGNGGPQVDPLFSNVKKYVYVNENGYVKLYDKKSAARNISADRKSVKVGNEVSIRMDNCGKNKVKWKTSNDKIEIINIDKNHVTVRGMKKGKSFLIAGVRGKTYKCIITVK